VNVSDAVRQPPVAHGVINVSLVKKGNVNARKGGSD